MRSEFEVLIVLKMTSSDLLITVPDDVFAPTYVWRGSFEYKGAKQPMTLTITSFNASTGKVNVTLTNRHSELLLSGKSSSHEHFCNLTCATPALVAGDVREFHLLFVRDVP